MLLYDEGAQYIRVDTFFNAILLNFYNIISFVLQFVISNENARFDDTL